MRELQRLKKIRDIGIRLQELQLVRIQSGTSYTAAALHFLFQHYRQPKPVGATLEQNLSQLAAAVVEHHQLPYARLSADAVLEFFCQRFQVSAMALQHPGYRAQQKQLLRHSAA